MGRIFRRFGRNQNVKKRRRQQILECAHTNARSPLAGMGGRRGRAIFPGTMTQSPQPRVPAFCTCTPARKNSRTCLSLFFSQCLPPRPLPRRNMVFGHVTQVPQRPSPRPAAQPSLATRAVFYSSCTLAQFQQIPYRFLGKNTGDWWVFGTTACTQRGPRVTPLHPLHNLRPLACCVHSYGENVIPSTSSLFSSSTLNFSPHSAWVSWDP